MLYLQIELWSLILTQSSVYESVDCFLPFLFGCNATSFHCEVSVQIQPNWIFIIIVADFNGFDGNVLRQDEWQIVIKYLDCQRQNDRRYQKAGGIFDKPLEALNLLIRYVIKIEAVLKSVSPHLKQC